MDSPRKRGRPPGRTTKHRLALQQLRKLIHSGRFPAGARLPPETELPQFLKVSRQTVRRAMDELVREGLIIRRHGSGSYVSDQTHPPLLPGRELRFAILVRSELSPVKNDDFFARVIQGALGEWGMSEVTPQWIETPPRDATRMEYRTPGSNLIVDILGESKVSPVRRPPLKQVREGQYDGFLTISITDEEWLDRVLDLNIPTVLCDYVPDRFETRADLVFVDPMGGVRAAVRHLLERGRRKIHFVGQATWTTAPNDEMSVEEWKQYRLGKTLKDPDSLLRQAAYLQEMAAHEIPVPEEWIHYSLRSQDAPPLIEERLTSLPENHRPDAVICHSGEDADRLIKAFNERGWPLDAAACTFETNLGPIHEIRADMRELGAAGGALLVSRLQRPARPYLRVGVRLSFVAKDQSPSAESIGNQFQKQGLTTAP